MIARCVAILALTASTCTAGERWEECQFVAYSQPQPFHLYCWGDDGKGLYGTFTYAAIPESEHPKVLLQISRSGDGPWKTVTRVRADREILQSGAPGDASRLRVRLGAFEPYLRSHEAGKIVLATGKAARISLSKLLREDRGDGRPK